MRFFVVAIVFLSTLLSCSEKKNETTEPLMEKVSPEQPNTSIQKRVAVVYHSPDGVSWNPFDQGIPDDATVSAFLIIGERILATTDSHGIYSSIEGEQVWKRMDENLTDGTDINAISFINNVLVIGTLRNGVMLSRDNGRTWNHPTQQINSSVRSFHVIENVLLAGADNGIFKSMDNGNTWEHTWKGIQVNGFTELNQHVYAALMNGAAVSNDKGDNWKYIYKPHALHDISTDGREIYAMTLGGGLKKSKNGGLTWENANTGLGTLNLYTFEVKGFAGKIYAAQWYGIYQSDNGGVKWNLIKNGLPDSTAFTTLETTKSGLIAGIGLR